MTTYSVFGDVNHENKTFNLRIMPDTEFMKLYGDCFTDGYWVGIKIPFALLFMKLDLEMALHRKKSYEIDYAMQGYTLA
jgi:hypothetical protein